MEPRSLSAYAVLPGQISFSALSGVSLPSLDRDYSAAPQSARSSGESYKAKDRFALPGPTWCQQFTILLRRIMWTRRFEVLSLPDASLVLVIALITGGALFIVSSGLTSPLACLMSYLNGKGVLSFQLAPGSRVKSCVWPLILYVQSGLSQSDKQFPGVSYWWYCSLRIDPGHTPKMTVE